MRLTQHTDYSLRVLMFLAVHPREIATIKEISEQYQISRNHLMKVVQKLVQGGFVESQRGQGGGLRLPRPPNEINLGEVIRHMEPDFHVVECFRQDAERCLIAPACALAGLLGDAIETFLDHLSQFSLADLVGRKQKREFISLLHLD